MTGPGFDQAFYTLRRLRKNDGPHEVPYGELTAGVHRALRDARQGRDPGTFRWEKNKVIAQCLGALTTPKGNLPLVPIILPRGTAHEGSTRYLEEFSEILGRRRIPGPAGDRGVVFSRDPSGAPLDAMANRLRLAHPDIHGLLDSIAQVTALLSDDELTGLAFALSLNRQEPDPRPNLLTVKEATSDLVLGTIARNTLYMERKLRPTSRHGLPHALQGSGTLDEVLLETQDQVLCFKNGTINLVAAYLAVAYLNASGIVAGRKHRNLSLVLSGWALSRAVKLGQAKEKARAEGLDFRALIRAVEAGEIGPGSDVDGRGRDSQTSEIIRGLRDVPNGLEPLHPNVERLVGRLEEQGLVEVLPADVVARVARLETNEGEVDVVGLIQVMDTLSDRLASLYEILESRASKPALRSLPRSVLGRATGPSLEDD